MSPHRTSTTAPAPLDDVPGGTPGGLLPAGPVIADPAPPAGGRGRSSLRGLRSHPVAAVALGWLAVVLVGVTVGPALLSYGPLDQDLTSVLSGPTAQHWLGTDGLGRDVLARLLVGGRPTLAGVLLAVAVFLAVAVPAGVLAGYFGGWVDRVVVLVSELLFAIPGIILLLVMLAVFGNSVVIAMTTLGVLASGGLIRVLRSSTMAVKQELYVRAARTSGLTEPQILRRHVLPRLAGPITVQTSLFAGGAILVETALGFLGFGTPPPAPSWGNLVATASQAINTQPWLLVPTGAAIITTVLALGLVGDAARDLTAARRSGGRTPRPGTVPVAAPSSGPLPADPTALLSVRGLSVATPGPLGPVRVVQEVSFDVRAGEVVGLVGESGCGKSVTSMAVLGLLREGLSVEAGSITFAGEELVGMPSRRRRALRGHGMAFISQEPIASLDPAFSVGQQLGEVVRRHTGVSRRAARRRVLELLASVRLPDPAAVARKHPHELSGGMAQRIGIAAALAGNPRLLVADEPTTALDVTVQAEILDLLDELRRTQDLAVVLVTHDFGVLADICDRAVVMYAGEVVETAPVADLLTSPRMPYSAALLRSNPAGVPAGSTLPAIGGSVPAPADWPVGCRFQDRCAFATADCAAGPVPLVELGPTRSARCLRIPELASAQAAPATPIRAGRVAAPAGAPLLQIEGLDVRYGSGRSGHLAVEGVSLSLAAGRTLGLVGESGAGKSTIGAAVLGLVPVSAGTIRFDGRDITHLGGRDRRALTREVQVVFQDPFNSLNPVRTVRQTLEEPLRLNLGLSRADTCARVTELLGQVGLPAQAADRYPAQFSGGQRQRIAIARALAVQPRLIVCDEAVSALDLSVQAQVLNLLQQLQADLGLAYLFVSHDLEVVRHMADDVAVLRHGTLREVGPAAQVCTDSADPYTRTLMASAPVPDPAVQARRREQRRALRAGAAL
ncbi:peptide/nickel transport system ATP-binding protein [Klenkia soli]|uniref:Peptide/nickel transport system ATP-binding protein n=1 Tax=Klenkia soli TaxID=1052260 RepID=A0A1H0QV52_9ACTN|nr:dipeptide ABC transporter ATP-binding protein [Klenkia soli]SDP20729.1 peptide/nickel transport system ATP-binding protein [Klenkia soli]